MKHYQQKDGRILNKKKYLWLKKSNQKYFFLHVLAIESTNFKK